MSSQNALPWVIGNWKMNSSLVSATEYFHHLPQHFSRDNVRVGIAAPSLYASHLVTLGERAQIEVLVQNSHWLSSGAFTGEISIPMLQEFNLKGSLVGHSERRQQAGETNTSAGKRAGALLRNGLTAILCVGETLEQRTQGVWKNVLCTQLRESYQAIGPLSAAELMGADPLRPKFAIAYEPVWAIGTGQAASPADANEAHKVIRSVTKEFFPQTGAHIPILYGGSVTPQNAPDLFHEEFIDGALVGGASLSIGTFSKILEAAVSYEGS